MMQCSDLSTSMVKSDTALYDVATFSNLGKNLYTYYHKINAVPQIQFLSWPPEKSGQLFLATLSILKISQSSNSDYMSKSGFIFV